MTNDAYFNALSRYCAPLSIATLAVEPDFRGTFAVVCTITRARLMTGFSDRAAANYWLVLQGILPVLSDDETLAAFQAHGAP